MTSAARHSSRHSTVDPLAETQPLPAFEDTLRMERISLAEDLDAQELKWFEMESDGLAETDAPATGCVGAPYLIAFAAALVPLVLSLS